MASRTQAIYAGARSTEHSPIIYRSVYFNSENRLYGTNDEPIFQIDPPLQRTHKIKLLAANIPISFYAFQNFTLTVGEQVGPSTFTITLNGNYTNAQLLTALSTGLTGSSVNGYTYTATYNSISGKITISSTGAFRIEASALSTSANKSLGFRSPSTSYLVSQTSDSVIQISRDSIIIESDELAQNIDTNSRSVYNNDSNRSIIGIVPISAAQFNYQYYESPEQAEYLEANEAQLSRVTLRCLDIYGNKINFNGVPWAIKLGIFVDTIQ